MPYILNGVATAFMFSFLYNFDSSPVNVVLRSVGLGKLAVKWLGIGYFSNFSLAFIGLWKYTGFAMVVFLGALKSIPEEYYEAAEMDGANFWQKTRFITLPAIKAVVQVNLFLAINGALQAFFEAFVITKGGPAGRTSTFVTSTVSTAFQFHDFGKASAMGVVLVLIVVALVSMQRAVLREDV
jgi:multiple sugar transport system permease protein